MSRLDAFWGDETVHDLHLWLSNALLAAVVLHLAGVIAMSIVWRENLPAGSYEVVLDLGARGIQRRRVDVKVCEITELRIELR